MYKSLWILLQEDNITSLKGLHDSLIHHIAPAKATLAWTDHQYQARQQWTINQLNLKAGAILILETNTPLDLDYGWPEKLGFYCSYQVEHNIVLPYPQVECFATYPFSLQICGFKFAEGISRAKALDYWRNTHAKIACENQSTLTYVQNLVTGQSSNAFEFDGWVEEGFPNENLSDQQAFFGGKNLGDTRDRLTNITESSLHFIDMSSIFVQHYSATRII